MGNGKLSSKDLGSRGCGELLSFSPRIDHNSKREFPAVEEGQAYASLYLEAM